MRAPKARLNGLEGRGQATGSLGGPGEHRRIAVKVIDLRGNEVVRVVHLQNKA
jgi:hypothetical protein